MNNCNRQNPRNTTTNRYRVRFFFYCYRTSLKPFQTVHSIRPLAGTMTVHGADIGGGGSCLTLSSSTCSGPQVDFSAKPKWAVPGRLGECCHGD